MRDITGSAMKLVILHSQTNWYVKRFGEYTRDIGEACDFKSEEQAEKFLAQHQLLGHRIVRKSTSGVEILNQ